jgi:adenylate cyclase
MKDQLGKWLERLGNAGVLPTDNEEERLCKAVLTYSSTLIFFLSFFWVTTYLLLGHPLSAAIPFGYQIISVISLIYFFATKQYRVFRFTQLTMMLILPVALQLSLGGFVASSGVMLWSLTAPLGALLFHSTRQSVPWFVAYAGITLLAGLLDAAVSSGAPVPPQTVIIVFFVMNILGPSLTAYLLILYFARRREQALFALDKAHKLLQVEQEKSERLLLNVLPAPIAERLKQNPGVIADDLDEVTILFADVVGFTQLSQDVPPGKMVPWLNGVFSAFDVLAARHGLEKIRTIGDSYMAAAGAPTQRPGHAQAVAEMALDMLDQSRSVCAPNGEPLRIRIGINTGPVVGAVIGSDKFIYDVYGDAVNTASRMESHGVPGQIQVTGTTYELLHNEYTFEVRGTVPIKGKGDMLTYLLTGRKVKTTRLQHEKLGMSSGQDPSI